MKLADKKECTGCGACCVVCPVNTIAMNPDEFGFLYPTIDEEKCIKCGLCNKVCHIFNNIIQNQPCGSYALQLKSSEDLLKVSSGGAFLAIAKAIIHEGGIVYGAIQTTVTQINHIRIDDEKNLNSICKSKYLQSNISSCLEQIKKDVKTGKVLFCGTPCQTNAVLSYLGFKHENLLLCDIICHGVPSPMAFKKYCTEIEKKYKSEIDTFVYRDKSLGWDKNQYRIEFKNGEGIKERSNINAFHGAYLQGLMYLEACETCRYAKLERISDFVLADFWKYEGKLKESNKGVSLVITYSEEANKLVKKLEKSANIEKVTIKSAIDSCRHLTNTPMQNKNRKEFLDKVKTTTYFSAFYRYAYARILLKRIRILIKK